MLRNTTRDEIVQAIRTLPVVGYMRSYRSFQNWGGEVSLLHIHYQRNLLIYLFYIVLNLIFIL